jgi:biopolymer transport protein ExbD
MMHRSRKALDPVKPQPLQLVTAPDVTPLLGILLVIVVSFMATLPSPQALDVRLPIDIDLLSYRPQSSGTCDPQEVVLSPDRLVWGGREMTLAEFEMELPVAISRSGVCGRNVFIAAASGMRYGDVAAIVDIAKGAGAKNIIMVPDYRDAR